MDEKKHKLNKTVYDYRQSIDALDEEFTEFTLKKYTVKDFFNLFDENFYDILRPDLVLFYNRSVKHIGGYTDPRLEIIDELEKEKNRIKKQILEEERSHPYFRNGDLLMDSSFESGKEQITGPRFLMHSGKKRRVIWDYSIFRTIKKRMGLEGESDTKIHIFIDSNTLSSIPTGPPIRELGDIFISNYEVNTYNN